MSARFFGSRPSLRHPRSRRTARPAHWFERLEPRVALSFTGGYAESSRTLTIAGTDAADTGTLDVNADGQFTLDGVGIKIGRAHV